MILLALALPVTAAVLLALAFRPQSQERAPAFRAFQACLAAGVGLALASCAFFLWYPLFGQPERGYVVFEAAVCVALSLLALWRLLREPRQTSPPPPPKGQSWTRWLLVPFGVSAVVAGVYLAAYFDREPHGEWDAFSIWNVRARFLFRGGDHWINAFSPYLFHADYPLFVSTTVARTWNYAGADSTSGPMALAVLLLALTVGTLTAAVNHLRGDGQGWLAGAVLLAAFPFVSTAGFQYADVPLSYFFLASVAALAVQDRLGGSSWSLSGAAGAAAGFASWTKNEGLLFLVALVLCRVGVHAWRRSWREGVYELIAFSVGFAPAGITLTLFKFGLAPPNDLVSNLGSGTLGRLLDWSRHEQVLRAVVEEVWTFGPFALAILVAYALLIGRPPATDRVRGAGSVWLVLAVVTVGYYLVYVTTPHDLTWHLHTSLTRLGAQLWPLFLFALFLTVDTPREAMGVGRAVPAIRRR